MINLKEKKNKIFKKENFYFLFVLLFIFSIDRYSKIKIVENFSDTGEPLAGMGGVMADPTMTFASNKMKGGDDKPVNEGKIIKYGDPDFVINDPSVRRVYLGEKFTL